MSCVCNTRAVTHCVSHTYGTATCNCCRCLCSRFLFCCASLQASRCACWTSWFRILIVNASSIPLGNGQRGLMGRQGPVGTSRGSQAGSVR